MRCAPLSLLVILCAGFSGQVRAQPGSPQAHELRAQLESIQQRLNALSRAESENGKVTEIGSSRGRSFVEEEPRLVVRIYDLSDLYSIAPSYRAQEPGDFQASGRPIFPEAAAAGIGAGPSAMGGLGGGGFGGGGGMFAVPSGSVSRKANDAQTLHQAAGAAGGEQPGSSRTSIDALIETITSTIAPDEWDEVGASITSLGASLIVSAPADTHDKIAALLDLFRKRWGSLRTVSLEAHWLWLTQGQLTAALAEKPEVVQGTPVPFGALSAAAWKGLKVAEQPEGDKRPGYHAVLTCYNGQTVHALAGGQRLAVVGLTPVVGGSDEQPAYEPQVRSIQEGAALEVTPVVTRTAKYVVIDVHSRVNLLEPAPAKANPPADADAAPVTQVAAALDRPALQSQRLSTTLRIPVGQPTLVGGMTFAASGTGGANLYLFVTAHVQELRDDEGGAVKADEPREPEALDKPDPVPPRP